jgi:hypothetical protein
MKPMLGRAFPVVTGLLAILLSPVLLAAFGVIYVFIAFVICPELRSRAIGSCEDCRSSLCPIVVLVTLITVPTLFAFGLWLAKKTSS